MAIPFTASGVMVSGFVGNISHDGPTRAIPGVLKSGTESNNVFGRAFTYESQTNETMQAGGSGVFGGIMINPKTYATTDGETAENGSVAEFLSMGLVYVELVPVVDVGKTPVALALGGKVYFSVTTGELTADPTNQATSPVANTEIKGATIVRHLPAAANSVSDKGRLAVIALTGPQPK